MSKEFASYKATKRLEKLVPLAVDLTSPENLTAERIQRYSATACGYKMLYATERVDEEILKALYQLADESQALAKMGQMQSGEVINLINGYDSEKRSVLHTATRDFFDNPQSSPLAQQAAALAKIEIDKLKDFLIDIDREDRYSHLLLVGIGGSELGPQAHYLALLPYLKPGRDVRFIANVDPDTVSLAIRDIDLAKTLVVVVSKTGTTLETKTNEAVLRTHFKSHGLLERNHFISVSMPGSPLDDPNKYRERFYVWDWIGGRYSTSSMVGGVMLGYAFGYDQFWELLRGANAMDKVALSKERSQNLPLLGALLGIWNRNFLRYPTLAVIPYSQALSRFPAHIQQLVMESQGKQIDQDGNPITTPTGPVIWGEPGTNAQHSFFQLIHQGTDPIPVEFIGYSDNQMEEDLSIDGTTSQEKLLSNLFAQSLALATGQGNENPNKRFPGNRPNHILLGNVLSPYTLGCLLSYYEHKVAFQAFIWGINAFDQEGVQLGKVLANKIIDRFAKPSGTPYPLGDALIEHLKEL